MVWIVLLIGFASEKTLPKQVVKISQIGDIDYNQFIQLDQDLEVDSGNSEIAYSMDTMDMIGT